MPRFKATDPQSGQSVSFEWYEDRPPTEADLDAIFAGQRSGGQTGQAGNYPLYGGSEAKMSAGEGESMWDRAREAVSQALFGSPEREEMRGTGVAMQPTTAEMAGTAATGALLLGGGAAASRAAGALPGMMGTAARAATNPKVAGTAYAGYRMARGDNPGEAVVQGALLGAAMRGGKSPTEAMAQASHGGIISRIGELLKFGRKAAPAAEGAAAPAAASGMAAGASKALPKLDPAEIEAYVRTMRTEHGLSGAQITGFLRSKYGIPVSAGNKIVQMILGG